MSKLFFIALFATVVLAQDLPLMPWPANVSRGQGELILNPSFRISSFGGDARLHDAALRLADRLFRETGIPISREFTDVAATLAIIVEEKKTDDESYHLLVDSHQARLTSTGPLGALRGMETLLQLVHIGPSGFSIPAVDIDDQPRFAWRGLSLDVSRHFIPPDAIKRTIDGLAAVKMNVLHWHLSDDQGFRVESKKYPKLQQKGSDGQFYTQAEIREIVAYAAARGVRIVPEFDIPGHATSWFPGYPNLASGTGPYEIVRTGGVLRATMDPAKESTYRFLDGFIGEMAKLFPDPYFHIGGDEVSATGEWSHNPHISAFMKKHKLADFRALQAYFNRRVQKIVAAHHKRMMGWDEILHPDLPKNVVIQSWRGQESLADAARKGYNGILSNGYYLDLMYPASQHYAVDPLKGATAGLSSDERKRILGGEAAMWEELATEENIDVKLWPRLAAVAERFWSLESVADPASMYRRLGPVSHWLETQGLEHLQEIRVMQERLAPDAAPQVAILASILEPMKGYTRHRARKYGSLVPFNRLVDAIPPESDAAREFADETDRAVMRRKLAGWRDNARAVTPKLAANPMLAEIVEVANAIEELCSIGLEALDSHPAPERAQAMLAIIDRDSKPKAEMLIQIAPSIRKIVDPNSMPAVSK
ncbi:MAG: family 20 glycosylhydrolase [Acidobacteriia bacterium]|nr:family 20 glycosylhydrolase [Terriglobia bacterium]